MAEVINGVYFFRKSSGGGASIANVICSTAENTPDGVSFVSGGSTITGTLAASASTISNRYFVLAAKTKTKNTYKEYVTIQVGDAYQWEELGTVDLDLDGYLQKGNNTLTANHILVTDSAGNVADSGKTTADLQDVIYGYMNNSTFYLTRTGSAGAYVYSDAVTPEQNKQYTDKEGNVPYIWDGTAYQPIGGGGSEPVNEVVTFNVSSSDGQATIAGLQLSVTISGQATPTILTLDANGQATSTIPVGAVYTVIYPIIAGYTHPKDANYAATNSTRSIYISYVKIDLANSTRSIVLEESSSPIWTLGGNADIVDNILGTYGSYVIDEVNKKYARLNPANHAQFLDGTAWSGLYGNAFRRLPRVYFMVKTNSNNKSVLYISPEAGAVEDATKFWPETWIGTYKGSVQSGKLSSRPNLNTTQNMTMSNFWAAAKALSPDYGLVNYFDHCMLNALALCKFGTADSPSYMGVGLQNAGSSYYTHTTGTTASLGDSTGSAPYLTTQYEMCKLFGIEDLAGSTWEFRPNIRFSGNTAIVYEGNVVSNDDPGIRSFSRNASLNGSYIMNMALGSYFDLICTVGGGSASTYWCDGSWASSGGQLLFVGGSSDGGSICGLSASISINAFSYSSANFGARLAFRGNIAEYDLVTGAQLAALH